MITEVYEALRSAGADEEKAKSAAEAIADYQRDISELKSDNRLIRWIVTFNLAIAVTTMWKVFS